LLPLTDVKSKVYFRALVRTSGKAVARLREPLILFGPLEADST